MKARFILLAMLPLVGQSADEGRVSYLEQEVRRLQQQVQMLSRRLDQLERPASAVMTPRPAPRPTPASDTWVDAGKWSRLRPGMSELEAVALLGTPTSMRNEDGARLLLYALEIGTSGYLGGSVLLRDGKVVEVRAPRLR